MACTTRSVIPTRDAQQGNGPGPGGVDSAAIVSKWSMGSVLGRAAKIRIFTPRTAKKMRSKAKIEYDELHLSHGGRGRRRLRRASKSCAAWPAKPYKVMLLDKQNHHCFQPLLYQVATASLGADSIAHPFRRTIGPMSNVAFRMAEVQRVDPKKKIVATNIGDFAYDILILALGSSTNFFGNRAMELHAMQLKSISQALDIRSDILQDFEAAMAQQVEEDRRRCLNFVIVGAGPTGVELAGSLAEIKRTVVQREYREMDSNMMRIVLVDSNDRVSEELHRKGQRQCTALFGGTGRGDTLGRPRRGRRR